MSLLLGVIGDDITGSTDLALMLGKNGMPTVQYIGVPSGTTPAPDAPAAVVALKSRTAPVEEAVAQSLAACRWLLAKGARQIFFKYCSTFDSTEKGNIGPVAEALLDAAGRRDRRRLPRLSRQRPDRLPRAPVRGRPASERIGDAAPPPDPDDRPEPGPLPRPAGPVGGIGRPRSLPGRAARSGGDPGGAGGACLPGSGGSPSSMPSPTGICSRSARPARR